MSGGATARGRSRRTDAEVGAVVLAAGSSRRMGGANKLLHCVDGAPMVCRVVDAFLAARARPVVVVTGHDASRVGTALGRRDVTLVYNAGWAEGMSTSLRAGLLALPAGVEAVVVGLADMPWVRAEHVDALVDAFLASGPDTICVPTHRGQRGNPVLWGACYFAELARLSGDTGGRSLLAAHAGRVRPIEVGGAGVLDDVDTPEDLAGRDDAGEGRSA